MKKIALMNLTYILKPSLRIRYCPQVWKKSLIMTIIKLGKDHSSFANYHPIALLSSMSKVFDKILLRKLTSSIGHKIRSEQFTFRSQHSITLQLLKITDQICKHTNNREKNATIFLDVEKLFGRIWHNGLI